jgi:hypothetical protein
LNKTLEQNFTHYRDKDWFKRTVHVPEAPVVIATTECIGTDKARANHLDAAIMYFNEQEAFKKNNVPL